MLGCLCLTLLLTLANVLDQNVHPSFSGAAPDGNAYLLDLYASWDYAVPFLLLMAMYWTTPRFEDNFYIHLPLRAIYSVLRPSAAAVADTRVARRAVGRCELRHPAGDGDGDAVRSDVDEHVLGESALRKDHRCAVLQSIYKVSDKLQMAQRHCVEIEPKPRLQMRAHTLSQEHKVEETSSVRKPSDSHSRVRLHELVAQEVHVSYGEFMRHLSKEFPSSCC